jgi:hypothetical protein
VIGMIVDHMYLEETIDQIFNGIELQCENGECIEGQLMPVRDFLSKIDKLIGIGVNWIL